MTIAHITPEDATSEIARLRARGVGVVPPCGVVVAIGTRIYGTVMGPELMYLSDGEAEESVVQDSRVDVQGEPLVLLGQHGNIWDSGWFYASVVRVVVRIPQHAEPFGQWPRFELSKPAKYGEET
jgi:hypothetical protein